MAPNVLVLIDFSPAQIYILNWGYIYWPHYLPAPARTTISSPSYQHHDLQHTTTYIIQRKRYVGSARGSQPKNANAADIAILSNRFRVLHLRLQPKPFRRLLFRRRLRGITKHLSTCKPCVCVLQQCCLWHLSGPGLRRPGS